MLNLERILNQDRVVRALTGLNRKAFDALLPSFAQAYQQTKAREGTVHDKRPLEDEGLVEQIPDEVAVEGDLGSQI